MRVLGIETSCDETAAAVVEDGAKILSNVVATSAEMHAKTGGIIPEQAARQQVRSIIPVIEEALVKASEMGSLKWEAGKRSGKLDTKKSHLAHQNPLSHFSYLTSKIDAIAVTIGPGLIGSLLVGVETAKTLAYFYKKPIIPVNHLAAHIYANWLKDTKHKIPQFPALALVVSGGHTDLVLMRGHGKLTWIGGTRDDAAGEAFDKTARLLGLPYPGGPAISVEAEKFLTTHNQPLNLFPRPMINEENYDWSFSGLKTAVLREVKFNPTSLKLRSAELAAQVQEAIVDVLIEKTLRAVKKFKPKSLLLSGGVAANRRLREKFIVRIKDEKLQVIFHVPHAKLCTDNATYIASHAHFNFHPVGWEKIKANPQLTIVGEE